VPTTLIIGGQGGNRASAEVAKTLGQYPKLGRAAAAAIPNATLVEFPELAHSPQIEAPGKFHSALLEAIR
jgi:pimeloyl-ACP methyl ester carboxylesterase